MNVRKGIIPTYAQGGNVIGNPRRVGLMPVFREPRTQSESANPLGLPQFMVLGGEATARQDAHNKMLYKLGGKIRGRNVGNIDTIPTMLAVNEIVIPRNISKTKKFKNYLSKNYNYNQKTGKFK